MARKDPHGVDLVRDPQPRRPVPTRRREVHSPRSPLDRPHRFAMPAIDDQVGKRLEGPQADGAVCRGREEVPWRAGGTGDGVERERVDGTGVGDQFARLRRVGLVKLRDAVGYPERIKTTSDPNRCHRHLCKKNQTRGERRGEEEKVGRRTVRRLVDLVASQVGPQSPEAFPVQAPQANVRFGETRRHDGRVFGEGDGRETVCIVRVCAGGSADCQGGIIL